MWIQLVVPAAQRRLICAETAETPGDGRGLVEAYAILAGTSTAERVDGLEKWASERLHQVGQDHLEAETLQDLNGIVGRTVKHHATIGELGIFPFAALAAVAEQAIFERAVKEQL